MLVYFMVRDDTSPAGWQSGVRYADGSVKPSHAAFRMPLVQTARRGGSAELWGQVRPRSGVQRFRVWLEEDDRAGWLGGGRTTDARGFFSIRVAAPAGSRVRIWSPRDSSFGHEVLVK
jgi:hypothetical protein